MNKIKYNIMLFSILLNLNLLGINLDSLLNEFKKTKVINNKRQIVIDISNFYKGRNNDSQILMLNYFETLNKKIKNDSIEYTILFEKGNHYNQISKSIEAKNAYYNCLKLAQKIKCEFCKSQLYLNFSNVYIGLNNKDSAQYFIERTIEMYKNSNDLVNKGAAYATKGFYHLWFNENYLSIKNYITADSIYKKLKNTESQRAIILINLSLLYERIQLFEKSIEYAKKAKENFVKLNQTDNIYYMDYILGSKYIKVFNYKEAKKLLFNSLKYYEKNNNPLKMYCYSEIAGAYFQESNLKEAQKYIDKTLYDTLFMKSSDQFSYYYLMGGKIYNKLGDKSKAINLFKLGLESYNEIKDKITEAQLNLELARIYKSLGENVNAIQHFEKHILLMDSFHQKKSKEDFQDIETKYQTKQKDDEIKLLSLSNKIEKQKKQNLRNILISALILLSFLIFVIYYTNKKKIASANKIKELDEFKSKFFSNISHEFRTPLTLIKSPLQSLLADEHNQEKATKLNLIDRNANRMLQLVEQILTLSKLQNKSIQFLFKKVKINPYVNYVLEPFKFQSKQNKVELIINNKLEGDAWIDTDVFEKIISNLVGNALKYTPTKGEIYINAEFIGKDLIHFEFKNLPVEINNPDKIFERYYKEDHLTQGAGIGLSLIKELIIAQNGNLTHRYENKTLIINVTLSINKLELEKLNGLFIESNFVNSEEYIGSLNLHTELPKILIADDNESILEVLIDLLKNEYKIFSANNGNKAYEIAKEQIPDIIITDVMMPDCNGFEFIEKLKKDSLTSYVPVIVLSADGSLENELKSVQHKAEGFLRKPFDNEILKAKIIAILDSRKILQEKYSKELVLSPIEIEIPDLDKNFIEKLQNAVESNLSNSEFSVEELASIIGMSRMQLHRKLKTILGMSANEYIKQYRLQSAKILLQNSKLNISEVAYKIGFENPNYFSKCYKDFFGISPKQE